MRPGEREVTYVQHELVLTPSDLLVAKAAVAGYQGGFQSDYLEGEPIEGTDEVGFGLTVDGYSIINALRAAALNSPQPHPLGELFPVSDEQREQARQMIAEYDEAQDAGLTADYSEEGYSPIGEQ